MRAISVREKTSPSPFSAKNPFSKRNAILAKREELHLFLSMILMISSLNLLSLFLFLQLSLALGFLTFLSTAFLAFSFKMKALKFSNLIKETYLELEIGDVIHFRGEMYVIERVGFKTYYLINLRNQIRKSISFRQANEGYFVFPTPHLSAQVHALLNS